MKFIKSPIFYILGLVIVMMGVGYHLKQQTVAEQEGNILKEMKHDFSNYSYNLYGACYDGQNSYYVVGSNGTILRSRDMGRTWNECSLDQPGKNLISICFIDEYTGWVVGTSGMAFETINGGQDWSPVKLRIGDTTLKRVYFFDKEVGWIVGEGPTILYTCDSGKNWAERQVEKEFLILNDIAFFNKEVGLAVGEYGTILYTENGGNTWVEHETPTNQAFMRIRIINEKEAWIVGLNGEAFRTEDTAKTWQKITVTLGDDVLKDHFFDCEWIPAAGTGNDVVYVIGDGVIARSFDLGRAWRHTLNVTHDDSDVRYRWFYDMVFAGSSSGIIVGKSGFIALTDDAERWERVH